MANKILGLDLGTNSIGICVRNADRSGNISDQLEYFTSLIFSSGFGEEKGREFSLAATRTSYRSTRRLYMSRKYRIWRTLEVLIEYGFCPLTIEQLDRWRKYDKKKGLKREYPTDALAFEQWVRLDFNGDGVHDYTSPYQLRAELMSRQFDFSNEQERFKLGRVLYHIAQRRGFKSSKGDSVSIKDDDNENTSTLKKSEEERSKELVAFMAENGCPTVGCAFALMENRGMRVRKDNLAMVVRAQYEEEIKAIFEYQQGLSTESNFYQNIISHKKGEGSIFYKRPLRSQKGTVGKCILEPTKSRCPISRPEFELFRAWSLINNIRFRIPADGDVKPSRELPIDIRMRLFHSVFVMARTSFKFESIRKWIKKNTDICVDSWNYKDDVSISGCPVIYRLKQLLGDDWQETKLNNRYTYEDLWHIAFSTDDEDDLRLFVETKLNGDEEVLKKLCMLMSNTQQGYADLSLKAIRNINYFLQKGYIYSDAVLLAKLPDLLGGNWQDNEDAILSAWPNIKENQESKRTIVRITNQLISQYKMLEPEEQFAYHNTDYVLQEDDIRAIRKSCTDTLGTKVWNQFTHEEQEFTLREVADAYQAFFASSGRDYVRVPNLADSLADYLVDNFAHLLSTKQITKLQSSSNNPIYHPSVVAIYQPVGYTTYKKDGKIVSKKMLKSPATNIFRNPMAMRVLHMLRRKINELIDQNIIDEQDTRVVIETAREFNDANMRAAIQGYQRDREKENAKFRKELEEYMDPSKITDADIEKVRLWHEQNEKCIYTGRIIDMGQLLNADLWEIEHTIPRSLSFDDSLANKTLCEYRYNRYVKQTKLPSELGDDYDGILQRIQPWIEKRESLAKQINTQRNRSKAATTKEMKDAAIRQRHQLEMEYRYWADKIDRFLIRREDLNIGFRSSQLNDTRIITKYAYHYLRTVFGSVTVQRGDMTASFRKAFGIQSLEEKKDRSNHAHHAIDATVLTLIPSNQKRDRILELFYSIEQKERYGLPADEMEIREYNNILKSCNLYGVSEVQEYIHRHIFVLHHSNKQPLTPASRKVRVRGKVVCDKDTHQPRFMRGDALRGELHKQTLLGAIAPAILDENGKIQHDSNGKIIRDTTNLRFVVRKPLTCKKNSTDMNGEFLNWDDLRKRAVDKALVERIISIFPEGTTLKEACDQGIYLNGCKYPIRHIRCYTTDKNPVEIKKQTYQSRYDYKNSYYAASGDLIAMAQYQCKENGKKDYSAITLFGVSMNRQLNDVDIPQYITDKKGNRYEMRALLHSGDMILVYNQSVDELIQADTETLSRHLYVIDSFEAGGLHIIAKHHACAKTLKELGKGESVKDFNNMPEKIRCGIRALNFMIENKDFKITPTGIEFI